MNLVYIKSKLADTSLADEFSELFDNVIRLEFDNFEFIDENNISELIFWFDIKGNNKEFKKIRNFRKNFPNKIIIARNKYKDEEIKDNLYNLGIDLYLHTNIMDAEIVSRLQAIIRSISNFPRRTKNLFLTKLAKSGSFTKTELSLIKLFFSNRKKTLSKTDILKGVWGSEIFKDETLISVYIYKIREKLEKITGNKDIIQTRRGYGYYLNYEKLTQ